MAIPRRSIGLSLSVTMLLVVVAGVYLYQGWRDSVGCTYFGSPLVAVAKAKTPLRKGQTFDPSMVEITQVPEQFLPPNPVVEAEVESRSGDTLLVDMERGVMILHSDFE